MPPQKVVLARLLAKRAFDLPVMPAFILAAILSFATPQILAARRERRIDAWKPTHYDVAITLNNQLKLISKARTEVTVVTLKTGVAEIDLDFGELTIDSVTVNKRLSRFTRSAGLLVVKLPRAVNRGTHLVIAVVYHGKPKDGLVMTNDKDGRPSVVGDNWPNRAHHWIPSLDHPSAKATVSFSINAPVDNLVVANGRLASVQTTSGMTRTWNYTEAAPIPPYCMIFAAGRFAKLTADSTITPLSYYVPRSDEPFALRGFAPAGPSLKFFAETIAPYPYEKLALIVGATQFGGMENSSAIVFASTVFNPDPTTSTSPTFKIRDNLVALVAHEIAHQWFGDSVTEETWSDLWLSEGFATYFAGLFIQRTDGESAFRVYMKNAAYACFKYEQQNHRPIHDTETEDLFKLLNPNNYQKGAWVLHMLRSALGDTDFFRGIRAYYRRHERSTATTEDLRTALEQESGKDLKLFFRRWVYESGHPQYEVSWQWQDKTRTLRLELRQRQSGPAFPDTLPIEITSVSGKRQHINITPNSKETIELIPLDETPSSVDVDPNNLVLKEVTVKNSRRLVASTYNHLLDDRDDRLIAGRAPQTYADPKVP
jgi:aminopeptidase N